MFVCPGAMFSFLFLLLLFSIRLKRVGKVIKYKLPPQTLTYGLSVVIKNTLLNYNFNFTSSPFPSFLCFALSLLPLCFRLQYLKHCFVNTDGQLS